jgi:hypothetical protein
LNVAETPSPMLVEQLDMMTLNPNSDPPHILSLLLLGQLHPLSL